MDAPVRVWGGVRAAALLLACAWVALPAPAARAWCRMTTSTAAPPPGACPEGTPLEWRRPCSSYYLYGAGARDLPLDRVRAVFEASFAAWEDIECPLTTPGMPNLEARLGAAPSECDKAEYNVMGGNVGTVVFVSDWRARGYDPTAYAVTTVWHSVRTGEIYDVDMELNQDGRVWAECPETGCVDGRVDLQNVVTHEAGHYFGLAHTNATPFATMWASAPPGETEKRTLDLDDIRGFCEVYPPGRFDGVACDDTPRGGLVTTCGGVPEDGCSCSAPGARRGDAGACPVAATAALAGLLWLRGGGRRRRGCPRAQRAQ
jgi:hypothetical protein